MEAALQKYKEDPAANTDAAVHLLDEWWVFYAGSLEDGTGSGKSAYILAEKRSKFFGTNTWEVGNGGKSKVNAILLSATNEFKRLLKAGAGNEAALVDVLKCVRAQLKVPLIQGCIQYAYKTDTTTNYPGEKTKARKGELWAFCSGVLPFLHGVNAADAATLRAETDILPNDDKVPSFANIKAVFSPTNLNKMGIKCADVGEFTDGVDTATTKGSDFEMCTDTADGPANADADSAKCAGSWLTLKVAKSSASANGGAYAFWLWSVLLSVALAAVN
jgi:hypothetical protein